MIAFLKRKKKPVENQDLLAAFVAKVGVDKQINKAVIDVQATWGARHVLEQQPVIHTPKGPVFGGKKEIAQKGSKLQYEVLAILMNAVRLPQLLEFVSNTPTHDEDDDARMKQLREAITDIMKGLEPDLDEREDA